MHNDDIDWIVHAHRQAVRRNDDAERRALFLRAIAVAGDALRLEQSGEVQSLPNLVRNVRTDRPIALVEPLAVSLTWSPRVARLWACDCAERALVYYEERLDDTRAVDALRLARLYAEGELETSKLEAANAAIRAAATSLVRLHSVSTAWSAAMAVVRCSSVSDQAWDGGRDAAKLAARNARWACGEEEGEGPEFQWQAERMLAYLTQQMG